MRIDTNESNGLVTSIRSLLAEVAQLDPTGAAELGAISHLRLNLAEPLQHMIEQAFMWLDSLQGIAIDRVSMISRIPGRDWDLTAWRALRDLCLAAKRELRFAVSDLTSDDDCWPDAVDRCERINARVIEALRLVVDAVERVSNEHSKRDAEDTADAHSANSATTGLRPTVEYPSEIISALCAEAAMAPNDRIALINPPLPPRRAARGSQLNVSRTATVRDLKPLKD